VRFIAALHHFGSPHPVDSGAILFEARPLRGAGGQVNSSAPLSCGTSARNGPKAQGAARAAAFGMLQIINAA
jgi:hypothetical protein